MNQRKGGKQYVCGAGIVIISLIAFYAVLSGTENKRILQVKNEIYTFEMTEEEAANSMQTISSTSHIWNSSMKKKVHTL